MDTQKAKFILNRPWLNDESPSKPGPALKTIPDWYRNADRFAVNPMTGKPWEMPVAICIRPRAISNFMKILWDKYR